MFSAIFKFKLASVTIFLISFQVYAEAPSSESTPGFAQNLRSDKPVGLTEARKNIETAISGILNLPKINGAEALKAPLSIYVNNWEQCQKNQFSAETFCLEHLNPDIQKGTALVSGLLSAIGANTANNCSKIGQAMDFAKTAMSAFTGNCGAQKFFCDSTCGKAKGALINLQKILPKLSPSFDDALSNNQYALDMNRRIVEEAIKAELQTGSEKILPKSIASKAKACSGYAVPLATSVIGIVSMVNRAKTANNCNSETNANVAVTNPNVLDCTKPENAQSTQCICERSPRTYGCSQASSAAQNQNVSFGGQGGSISATAPSAGTRRELSLGANGDPGIAQGTKSSSSGGSDLPGPSAGGGSSLGGGGSSGQEAGGYGHDTAAGGTRRFSTNIYSGEMGGGGGYYSGSRSPSNDSALKQYLPGGAKDPHRREDIAAQITKPMGKSLWDKVSGAYVNNRPSFLGGD